jgi:photosystem II stability/assembly factor-like uncharacterized protein
MADRHDGREPRDDVDSWLNERIDPLLPPPGTFDLIKRRARRRKYRRLAITASTAAVLVAAAVTVPQVVNLPMLSPTPTSSPAAGAGHPPSASASVPSSGTPSTAASAASRIPSVPADFQPTSVTFVGPYTGWVIGQAGSPGRCATQYCTSVARTNDAGRTWSGVPAPLTGAPDGATGVSQIRFLDLNDGWAFGPGLFVTHSGGKAWTAVDTGGLRVTDLETVGTRVFALWASCTGTGAAYASGCSSFTLYSAPASGGSWAPAGAATTGLAYGQSGQAPSLALTGSRGYLLTADGTLYSGPVDGSAAWQKTGSLPDACDAGGTGAGGQPTGAQPNGAQPNGALLGAANASDLLLTCLIPGGGSNSAERKLVYSSPNRGASWLMMATAPPAGIAASLAASPSESLMLATDRGIELLPKGEIAWQAATLTSPAPAGGFSYLGMTTDEQGIALPADPGAGAVWFTFDGGQTWKPSAITSS